MSRRKGMEAWLVAGLLMLAGTATAQAGDRWGGHPMMGGGYGPGMMGGGYGPGWGHMDDGWGGPMGPGMMGGIGPGGLGMGPGMGGHLWTLNLSDKQIESISNITNQHRERQWKLMTQMMQGRQQLARLYAADPVDTDAVVEAYDRLFEQQKAMIRSMLETRNQVMAQLTDEQKQQLQQRFRGNWGPRGQQPPPQGE